MWKFQSPSWKDSPTRYATRRKIRKVELRDCRGVSSQTNNQPTNGSCLGFVNMHQDGEGFNIVLQALPINGKIVLRPPKAQTDEPKQTPGKDNVRPLKNSREK